MIVLSENDEVHLSSQGLLSSLPSANGIMADLGGGSLELSLIKDGKIEEFVSLKIGVVRFLNNYLKNKKSCIKK